MYEREVGGRPLPAGAVSAIEKTGYNALMNHYHLARIEAQIERIIEGAFAQLFRQRISAHDLLLQLTRAFEHQLSIPNPSADSDKTVAPDLFVIRLHPDVVASLSAEQPQLLALLAEHLSELGQREESRLLRIPSIQLHPDAELDTAEIIVEARHQARMAHQTDSLRRIEPIADDMDKVGAQLLIDGDWSVPLEKLVTNIGRSRDNDIMLTDPTISRHHGQIRLRFGAFTLFDNDSQHGTYVNEVRIREHRLQDGDVIQMGKCRMIFLETRAAPTDSETAIYPRNHS